MGRCVKWINRYLGEYGINAGVFILPSIAAFLCRMLSFKEILTSSHTDSFIYH